MKHGLTFLNAAHVHVNLQLFIEAQVLALKKWGRILHACMHTTVYASINACIKQFIHACMKQVMHAWSIKCTT